MTSLLVAWVSREDLAALVDPDPAELGPTLRAVQGRSPDRVALLWNHGSGEEVRSYPRWVEQHSESQVELIEVPLPDPSNHLLILDLASRTVEELTARHDPTELEFLLSSGTPAMHAVWLLLAKARFHARLVKCSVESGTEVVELPFDISADFAMSALSRTDERLVALSQGLPPEAPEFSHIVARCGPMQEAVAIAQRLAPREVPVLVLGESGTGKELFARAIHKASRRSEAGFLALNCGAIPRDLIDARLFGHAKGAFTGAIEDRPGVFEEAHGGTLFLDEIGELPLEAQVRLLRVLQEGEVVRVGEHEPRPVDVRVVAATHVDLFQAVRDGGFRLDLLYRLAVGIVHLPPLRQRGPDLHELVDRLLEEVQAELAEQPDFQLHRLSRSARARIREHDWPGNVRELRTTLVRAALFAPEPALSGHDIEHALLPTAAGGGRGEAAASSPLGDLLGRPLGEGFDMRTLERELRSHYVRRALAEADGVKSRAARLLGVPPQTFQSWAL